MTPDIKLAEVTLAAIRTIRECGSSKDPESILVPACVKIVKLLMSTINVDGGSLYYTSRAGDFVKVFSIGSRSAPPSFTAARSTGAGPSNDVVLPIPITGRKSYLAAAVFGYLSLYRREAFSETESHLIQDMLQFLAHLAQYGWEMQLSSAIETARRKIDQVLQSEQRPGSVFGKTLASLHVGVQARASYYGVVIDDCLSVDYVCFRQFRTCNQPHTAALPRKVIELMQGSSTFVLSDSPEVEQVAEALRPLVPPAPHGATYVASVYSQGNDPLGMTLVEFDKARYFNEADTKVALAYRQADLARWAGFLYQRRTSKMIANPIFRSRDTRLDEKVVFVLMPFDQPWSDRIWSRLVRPTVESEGLVPVRGDDLYGRDIMEDIWQGIVKARIVIADITGRNPNVFYELGIAHTVGKPVILMTQNVADIPFDLNRFRHIVYQDNMDGYDALTKHLRASMRDVVAGKAQ
ncbi:MAG TPA: hypothetical protein VLW55_05950 [Burkholderiaceae bacterium]|nr:hypothetical protein [Burkholderiaceae bacterium]